jgi:hypothetical protein
VLATGIQTFLGIEPQVHRIRQNDGVITEGTKKSSVLVLFQYRPARACSIDDRRIEEKRTAFEL